MDSNNDSPNQPLGECADEVPSGSPPPGTRMVLCVKFDREMPGIDRPPYKDELGHRIFENVSQEAWNIWLEQQKMILNENRLSPIDPEARKFLKEQTHEHFFGEGANVPEGYVPQTASK